MSIPAIGKLSVALADTKPSTALPISSSSSFLSSCTFSVLSRPFFSYSSIYPRIVHAIFRHKNAFSEALPFLTIQFAIASLYLSSASS